jgi:hypothetical protein
MKARSRVRALGSVGKHQLDSSADVLDTATVAEHFRLEACDLAVLPIMLTTRRE